MNDEFHPILHDDHEAQIFFLPPKKLSIIPLTYLASILFLLCFFTIFLLKLEKEILWEYWKVFVPLYFCLGLMSLTIYGILTHQKSPYEGLGKNVFLSDYFFAWDSFSFIFNVFGDVFNSKFYSYNYSSCFCWVPLLKVHLFFSF